MGQKNFDHGRDHGYLAYNRKIPDHGRDQKLYRCRIYTSSP